jgi:hypothetical protein
MRGLRLRLALGFALAVGGCVVYEPVPVVAQPTVQQRFDRSWAAAAGALADQGVTITAQDRDAGVVRGERGGIGITASVRTLADGRIEVKFDQTGTASSDPGLVHRISESYDRRMGR